MTSVKAAFATALVCALSACSQPTKTTEAPGPIIVTQEDPAAPAAGAQAARDTHVMTSLKMLELLKGGWSRCRLAVNEAGEAATVGGARSFEDRYEQSGPTGFAWIVARSADKKCSSLRSESRSKFECEALTADVLQCKRMSMAERRVPGEWVEQKPAVAGELALSLKVTIQKKDGGSNTSKADAITMRVASDEAEESETFSLTRILKAR